MWKSLCKDGDGDKLFLKVDKYCNNNRLYLGLEYCDSDGDFWDWGDLTTNLSYYDIESESIVFINSDVSERVFKKIVKTGLLYFLGTIKYNNGTYRKCFVNKGVMENYINHEKDEED